MYKSLDPGVRVVILKALCDIRVEVLLMFNVSVAVVIFFTLAELNALCSVCRIFPIIVTFALFCCRSFRFILSQILSLT